jgi:hypothetical protein
MGTALGSFKVKLVLYFVLLSLLPIAAAFWGFTSVAGQSETRRVDARLQAGLRSALTTYQGRLDDAQSAAQALASNRAFQAELQQGNVPILTNMLRDSSGIYVLAAGNAFHVGPPPPLAGQRLVQVFTRIGLVGTVYGYVPLDETLVDTVRQRRGSRRATRSRSFAARRSSPRLRTCTGRCCSRRAGRRRSTSRASATALSSHRRSATAQASVSPCSARSR